MKPRLRKPIATRVAIACCVSFCSLVAIPSPLAAEAQGENNPKPNPSRGIFNVRDFGAVGDGIASDTEAITRAVEACTTSGGGQVLIPPGRFRSGTIELKSNVTLYLDAGARLIGTTNLSEYRQPVIPTNLPEARWGKWHRALIIGQDLENVAIAGQGVIDGNKVFDPTGEERRRGPHTLNFVSCKRFIVRDVTILDAANYAIFFQVSDDVEIRNVKIYGGWDGVHWRGAPDRWCRNVTITGSQLYTGDDAIAGRYWTNTLIANCIINASCNGIRLIGPATKLIVDRCLFYGPGEQPHRSSGNRNNMLCGILLQPSGWDPTHGLLDDVLLSNNTMHNLATPVTLWTKTGNPVGRVTVDGLKATGAYRSAVAIESWGDASITNVVIRDASVEFAGGGKAEQATQEVRRPGVDVRPLPAWGIYARNVENLTVEDSRLSLTQDDLRPVIMADHVQRLRLDHLRFPTNAAVAMSIVTTNIGKIQMIE